MQDSSSLAVVATLLDLELCLLLPVSVDFLSIFQCFRGSPSHPLRFSFDLFPFPGSSSPPCSRHAPYSDLHLKSMPQEMPQKEQCATQDMT